MIDRNAPSSGAWHCMQRAGAAGHRVACVVRPLADGAVTAVRVPRARARRCDRRGAALDAAWCAARAVAAGEAGASKDKGCEGFAPSAPFRRGIAECKGRYIACCGALRALCSTPLSMRDSDKTVTFSPLTLVVSHYLARDTSAALRSTKELGCARCSRLARTRARRCCIASLALA